MLGLKATDAGMHRPVVQAPRHRDGAWPRHEPELLCNGENNALDVQMFWTNPDAPLQRVWVRRQCHHELQLPH